jgi:hypothetical protein
LSIIAPLFSDTTAKAVNGRARGFIDEWTPQPATWRLIGQITQVLEDYTAQLPLTARQVFYRLVATADYPKDERAYKRLTETLQKARRAGFIKFADIRDDGGAWDEPYGFAGVEALKTTVDSILTRAPFAADTGQPRKLMVICEAGGMVPMLSRVAHAYGAPVLGAGGFQSVSQTHALAEIVAAEHRPVVIFHIGDHDPSGVHLFQAAQEDVTAFAAEMGGEVYWRRIAVTPEQIRKYGLPTAPAKATDRRSFDGETVQAEALDPATLQRNLLIALEANFDNTIHDTAKAVFLAERDELRRKMGGKP